VVANVPRLRVPHLLSLARLAEYAGQADAARAYRAAAEALAASMGIVLG
jgi:hypothetical protein